MQDEILRLKKEKDICILAHVLPAITAPRCVR